MCAPWPLPRPRTTSCSCKVSLLPWSTWSARPSKVLAEPRTHLKQNVCVNGVHIKTDAGFSQGQGETVADNQGICLMGHGCAAGLRQGWALRRVCGQRIPRALPILRSRNLIPQGSAFGMLFALPFWLPFWVPHASFTGRPRYSAGTLSTHLGAICAGLPKQAVLLV